MGKQGGKDGIRDSASAQYGWIARSELLSIKNRVRWLCLSKVKLDETLWRVGWQNIDARPPNPLSVRRCSPVHQGRRFREKYGERWIA
jgi:hypothetical protein